MSLGQEDEISDFCESLVLVSENESTDITTEYKQHVPIITRVTNTIIYGIQTFFSINYSVCIMTGLLLALLSIFLSNKHIEIEYKVDKTEDTLCVSSIVLFIAILTAAFIILTLCIQIITSYIQHKKKGFSHTIYIIYSISDNITIMTIALTLIIYSHYSMNNFTLKNYESLTMTSHDLIGLVILGSAIISFSTSLVKTVSFNLNRDTFMERMLMTFKVDYFLKLLNCIRLFKGNDFMNDEKEGENTNKVYAHIKDSDIWEYAFPWVGDAPTLSDYTTSNYEMKKMLYFTPNINQIPPEMRNWIYKEFKKRPESILYGTGNLDLQNHDLKYKKINKLMNKNIKTVKDIKKYFASKKNYDMFCTVMNFTDETKLKSSFISNLFRRNIMEKRYIQASLVQINGCLKRIQTSFYIVIGTILIVYTSMIGFKSTPMLFTLVSAFFGTGFAFQPSVKNAIDSILFLLCIHPYDVGDRVFIILDDKMENLIVSELNVFSTVFTKFDGSVTIVPNNILRKIKITNVRRSRSMAETYRICINSHTMPIKIAELRSEITEYVNQKLDDFSGAVLLNIDNVQDANKMYIKVFVQYKRNWHDYYTYLRLKNNFLLFIVQRLREKGLMYEMPMQPIKLLSQPSSP